MALLAPRAPPLVTTTFYLVLFTVFFVSGPLEDTKAVERWLQVLDKAQKSPEWPKGQTI